MTVQTLHIEFEPSEGALLRLIGLIERRGYDVASLHLPSSAGGDVNLDLGVRPRDDNRDISILQRQIRRLIGVRRVLGELEIQQQKNGG
ncbi:MAG: acetolactate synthase 3 regulatory subunit domain protein [Robiginitomaculum sp.]|nr:MAG: acetolactate synthase 3 regulatory subunit domain protein [Robiginitomaculum sp.]